MKISRLRLMGFKSFVEPTELLIEGGLTGVVGPNGCGKSNLLEALRWVMGETSFKSMRASAMEDVIFSGTAHRPARNAAEVMVVLDNAGRSAPAEFNDSDQIEIVRRIERDAGSVYKVNAKDVRARDVKLLFEDAATGARSHALVRQGQIGEIISAKPEKRRRVLEDAAGIAGLHSRRHEAELRLRAAENNIERLQDVLSQLVTQMNGLKRQARQAKRYKEISAEIGRCEAIQLHLEWLAVLSRVEHDESQLREMLKEVALATEAEAKALRLQADAADTVAPLREQEAKCAAALHRLQVELETLDRESARAELRHQELVNLKGEVERDLLREHHLIKEAKDTLLRLEREAEDLTTAGDSDETVESEARQSGDEMAAALAQSEARLAAITTAIAEHQANQRQIETAVAEAERALLRFSEQLEQLDSDRDALLASAPDVAAVTRLNTVLAERTGSLAKTQQAAITAENTLSQAAEAEREATRQAGEQRLALRQLETEVETLRKLVLTSSDMAWPSIVDQVKVDPGYEVALGAALGDDLDAALDRDAPAHWRRIDSEDADTDPSLPDGTIPLAKRVDAPPELGRRLAQVGLVDAAEAEALQKSLRPGQRLVTREGALWRWDGLVTGADAPTAAAKRLAGRNRLIELEAQLADTASASKAAERTARNATDARATAETVQRQAHEAWRQAQAGETEIRDQLSAAERRAREVNEKLAAHAEARAHAETSQAEAKQRLHADRTALQSMEPIDGLRTQQDELRTTVAQQRTQLAEDRAILASLEHKKKLRDDRCAAITVETELWRGRAANAGEHVGKLEDRKSALAREIIELEALPAQLEERRAAIVDAIADAERARRQASDQLANAENEIREREKVLRELQSALSDAREQRARAEAHLEAARARQTDHARQIRETLGCTPDGCLESVGLSRDDELPDREQLDLKFDRLRVDRERLGGVNLRAEHELSEITGRHDSLENERADLEEAIARLRQGIAKLNKEGRRRLLDAFEEVNDHFQKLFTTLFGGGTAELQLIESDDPLESGLELVARPPGKKPTVLSLLSGGEQALTALSLIFAVFLTNPSPICVLDEVDAPLDDANVDRFCTLMEEMAKSTDTRFLVITHHPMTMSRMDRLFGVTMAERGVSQLVSVDLETAESYREAG